MHRKLLMVANYFPPMASGGNARQLRFIRYLPESGWEPVVLSARATGPVPDPPGVRIYRAAAPSPQGLYEVGRRLSAATARARRGGRPSDRRPSAEHESADAPRDEGRLAARRPPRRLLRRELFNDWLFVPDPYVGWVPPGVLLGRRLLRQEHFDALFSSFPRASTHLIAAWLAYESGLPWLADYRDPWPIRQSWQPPTPLHRRAHFALERLALAQAHAATAINEPIAEDLRRRYPALAPHVHVIPNGFDPEEEIATVELPDRSFWLVHTGRLYGIRVEHVLRFLEALATLPDDVKVLFLGVEGPLLHTAAAELGISERVHVLPLAPRKVARGYQRAAGALLLLPGVAPESLTSKIFEYLVADRPIVALTSPESAAASLLAETGGGWSIMPDETLAVRLAEFVRAARSGSIAPPAQDVVARFDGRGLTGELAVLLDEMVDRHEAAAR
jgi:glycosyltransferase involved in cell wall biosynthesis